MGRFVVPERHGLRQRTSVRLRPMGEGGREELVLQVGTEIVENTMFTRTSAGFRHCLPYFKKAQRHELSTGPNDPFRGHDGPLHVIQGRCENLLHKAFMAAGEQVRRPSYFA